MKKILLKNAFVLDGTRNMKLQQKSILVNGNKIEEIGNIQESKDYKVIDLSGKYIIPGLINLHVHLPGSGKMSATSDSSKKLVNVIVNNKFLHFIGIGLGAKYAKTELLSGVTTLRAVGGIYTFDSALRDLINANKKIGPRIIACNYAIAPKDGHMAGTVSHVYNTKEEAVNMVDELVKSGADWIKIMITGGVLDATVKGEPGVLKMQPDEVKAICDRAHALGYKVAAHVESYEGCKVAIENGVDTIEHGCKFDDKLLKLAKEKGTRLVTTLSPALPICLDKVYSDFVRYNSFVVFNNIVEGAKSVIDAGEEIGLGTDTGCPYTTHYDFWRELDYATHFLHISPEDALYYGTLGNAKIVNKENEIGSLEKGKFADLVVLNANPLDNFRNINDKVFVMKDGKVYKQKVKKYKEVEEFLEKIYSYNLDEEFKKL